MNKFNQCILTFSTTTMLLTSSGCAHKEELQITPILTPHALVEQYAYVGELHNEGLQAIYNQLKNDKIVINRSSVDVYLKTTLNTTEAFFTDYHNQHPAVNLFGTQQDAEQVFQHQRARLLANVNRTAGGANPLGNASFKTSTVSSSADYNSTVSQSVLSDKQKTLLKLVAEASDNAANSNEFNTLIGLIETRAATELPANEQATVFVVTSTARASATYWNAHAQEWAVLTGNDQKVTVQHRVTVNNWWRFALKCAIADAGGALGGIIGAVVGSGVEAACELIG